MEANAYSIPRLDERIRQVEVDQGKLETKVDNIRGDIKQLEARVDRAAQVGWGIVISLLTCAATILGAFIVPH